MKHWGCKYLGHVIGLRLIWGWVLLIASALCPMDMAMGQVAPSAESSPMVDSTLYQSQKKPAAAVTTSSLDADEITIWQRYIRGFRREHNLALTAGGTNGRWYVAAFGPIENETFHSQGVFTRGQYSFHFPIYKGFGYVLGSGFGYHYQLSDSNARFRAISSLGYPGLVAGFTLNLSPRWRVTTAVDYGLERFNGMSFLETNDTREEISITAQAGDFCTHIDYFYNLTWGVRLEGHYRITNVLRPKLASGFPVDVSIRKVDTWVGIGLVYHAL